MNPSQKRKITRRRIPRACTECRRRKLKCDQERPCSSCALRSDAASCVYLPDLPVSTLRGIDELETGPQNDNGPPPLSPAEQSVGTRAPQVGSPDFRREFGSSETDTVYAGATDWTAMLDNIRDLDVVPSSDSSNMDVTTEAHHGSNSKAHKLSGILYGSLPNLSLLQVLERYLPPRRTTDRLVAAYTRATAVVAPFIHIPQFGREYESFWTNTAGTPALWISILFSMLDVSMRAVTPTKTTSVDDSFVVASAHCLRIGNYTRPQARAVEALLLFIQASCLAGHGLSKHITIAMGTLVRMATNMGYHREPGPATRLSTFQKEMRRRTWSLCMQLDVLISFHFGLPTTVQYPTWNTRPPANLLDSDFDEDTFELPPSRPESEATEQLFYIAKHKLIGIFEKVLRHALATDSASILDAAGFDDELRAAYSSLPANFQVKNLGSSTLEPPSVLVARLCVRFIYLKSLCVLHRPHAAQGNIVSTKHCHDASTELVETFVDIYDEFKSGGLLETEKWFLGDLTWHDFLLGCMALCLMLRITALRPLNHDISDLPMHASTNLLVKARLLCQDRSSSCRNSSIAQQAIAATLAQLELVDTSTQQHSGGVGLSEHPGSPLVSEPFTAEFEPANWLEQLLNFPGGNFWAEPDAP